MPAPQTTISAPAADKAPEEAKIKAQTALRQASHTTESLAEPLKEAHKAHIRAEA